MIPCPALSKRRPDLCAELLVALAYGELAAPGGEEVGSKALEACAGADSRNTTVPTAEVLVEVVNPDPWGVIVRPRQPERLVRGVNALEIKLQGALIDEPYGAEAKPRDV